MSASRSMKARISSKEWGLETDFGSDFVMRDSRSKSPLLVAESSDKSCKANWKIDDGSTDWLEKHAPTTRGELAVHKSKVDQVQSALNNILSGSVRNKVVVLTGPTGCGKSTTVRVLARDLHITVEEWINPVATYVSGVEYESEIEKFRRFLLGSGRYGSLFTDENEAAPCSSRKVILVEDIPNFAYMDKTLFWEMVRTHSKMGVYPCVVVISDRSEGYKIPQQFPIIQFNPVNMTALTKALKLIGEREGLSVTKEDISDVVGGSQGDLRTAISTLRFQCSGNRGEKVGGKLTKRAATAKRRKIDSTKPSNRPQASIGKDNIIIFHHLLGKLMYAKRVPGTPGDCADTNLARAQLEFNPETIVDKCVLSPGYLATHLHQNYLNFQTDTENLQFVCDMLCDSDAMTSYWTEDDTALFRLESTAKSIAPRAVIFAKDPKHVPKFRAFTRPLQKDVREASHKFAEECKDAFALQHLGCHSSFILDALPFYSRIRYHTNDPTQSRLIHKMSKLKSSFGYGIEISENEELDTKNSGYLFSESIGKEDLDISIQVANDLDAEIEDFSD